MFAIHGRHFQLQFLTFPLPDIFQLLFLNMHFDSLFFLIFNLEDVLLSYQQWVNDTRDSGFEMEPVADTARITSLKDASRIRYGLLNFNSEQYLMTHWRQERPMRPISS